MWSQLLSQRFLLVTTNIPFGIWPSKHMPKNWSPEIPTQHVSSSHFTTGSQPIQYLFSQTHPVHVHVHSHCYLTHHHIIITSSSPRWSPFSSTYLLLKRSSSQIQEWQRKDLNRNYFIQFCLLCREEWHEVLRSAWTTSLGPDTTDHVFQVSSWTPPEEIHCKGRPRAPAILWKREIWPEPGDPTKRSIKPLVDDEQGLERGANSEGFVKGMDTPLEGEACGDSLPTLMGVQFV